MMTRSKHVPTIFGLALLGCALALWARPGAEAPTPSRVQSATMVRVASIGTTAARRTVRFSAVTRAAQRAALSFPMAGRLVTRGVEVGDHVRRGQVLAAVDDGSSSNAVDSTRASVAELAARVEQAERDRERVQYLVGVKAATAEEVEHVSAAADAVKAAHAAAAARLDEARRMQGETVLRAPFAGTVTAVRLEPGERTRPGVPVIELSGDGLLELRVEVPESVVASLQEGQTATARLPFAGGAKVSGRITSVARAAVGPGGLFPVIVTLDASPGLAAGMTAELLLDTHTGEGYSVPIAAVVNPGSSWPAVFVVREGRARRVPVELGQIVGERVMVSGELTLGEPVVVAGNTQIADGDPVEVQS